MREFMSTDEALAFTTGTAGWENSNEVVIFTASSDSVSWKEAIK